MSQHNENWTKDDLRIRLKRTPTGNWNIQDTTGFTSPHSQNDMPNFYSDTAFPSTSQAAFHNERQHRQSNRPAYGNKKLMAAELKCIEQQQIIVEKELEILINKQKSLDLKRNIALASTLEDDDEYDTAEEDIESLDSDPQLRCWFNQQNRQHHSEMTPENANICEDSSTKNIGSVINTHHILPSECKIRQQPADFHKFGLKSHNSIDNLSDDDVNKKHMTSEETKQGHQPQRAIRNNCQLDECGTYHGHTSNVLEKFIARSTNRDLPIFSGEPLKWPQFIAEFENSTRDCKFNDAENQDRLRKCLRGKAREVVDHLLILPQSLDEIITILRNRFGRPDFIINHLLEKLSTWPSVKEGKPDSLTDFYDFLTSLISTLKILNEDDHLRNPILFRDVLRKIPQSQSVAFIEYFDALDPNSSKIKILEFHKWIGKKANAACQILTPAIDNNLNKSKGAVRKDFTCNVNPKLVKQKIQCKCCASGTHDLKDCDTFKCMDVEKKWEFVVGHHYCFSCLKSDHNLKNCRRRKSCGIESCEKPHNQLLHKPSRTQSKPKILELNSNNGDTSNNSEQNFHVKINANTTILKVLPVKLKGPKMTIKTFALLDDASTATLIDEDVANDLGLDGPSTHLQLEWMNKMTTNESNSKIVSLSISGDFDSAKSFTLRHVKTKKDLSLPIYSVSRNEIRKYFKNLPNVSFNNGKPLILIGQNHWHLLTSRKVIYGPWNGPAISRTALGWVVHGNISNQNTEKDQTFHIFCQDDSPTNNDDLDTLHELVKEHFKFDLVQNSKDENSCLSKDDKRCIEILDQTVQRINDHQFECGLLWKRDDIVLPESKKATMKRLYALERKMDEDEIFANAYIEKFNDYVQKGYIKKLSSEEIEDCRPSKLWYLPHFGVTTPNKPGKLRIVFDAASKSHGKCLNDFLLTGPDLYNSLQNMLLNFRIHPVAFVADIKEMFLQVRIRHADRPAQRLLWRGMNRQTDPDVYELQVVFFGSTSGPCLAQEIKNRNAKEFMDIYPEACHEILNNHYMDDYLGGASDSETAIRLIKDIITVHKQANFTICNWISNDDRVIESIDKDLRAKNHDEHCFDDDKQAERILGIWWDWKTDMFTFPLKMHKICSDVLTFDRRPTKRDVLKVVMSIFDPLGLLVNFVIGGKILLQKIWESNISWDDQITDSQYSLWKNWVKNLDIIKTLTIPRRYTTLPTNECGVELHVFCDASQEAYSAVAYLRFINENNIDCVLINAKSRVAPLKPLSIPRLELQAALLGAKLAKSLKESLHISIKATYFWCDSENVLRWLKSSAKRYKIFVGHRIGEIQELSNISDWYYVPTKQNIADDATKVKPLSMDTWFNGPNFLYEHKSKWPCQDKFKDNNVCDTELRPEHVNIINDTLETIVTPNVEKFTNYSKFLRSTAWIFKCFDKGRKYITDNNTNELLPRHLLKAEKVICRKIQLESYPNELKLIQEGKQLPKSSPLKKFVVFIDDEQIIRIHTRLDYADLDYDSKNPILLDFRHPITQLLIAHYHVKHNHIGIDSIVCDIRSKYWIPQLRNCVKKIALNCQHCKNKKAKPQIPIMGQLPACRVTPTSRPFINCGVDYFGPIEITNGRKREKRYGAIFTCMAVRAVHIEIAHDLSSNSFIHVFRQFGSRRGFPENLYSDNGTNFRKSDKEIANAIANWPHDEITREFTMKYCAWHFNPPSAPHMGGSWERLIRSIKEHLKELLKERYPPEYVLRTLLCEIESIINSRPLTNVPLEADDAKPLTPNDLLIGPDHLNLKFAETNNKDLIILKRWQATQQLVDIFWKRFNKEYLSYIMHQNKWLNKCDNLAIDDIVLLADPELPRNCWPRGIITQVYPGRDKQVRVADVKTKYGIYKRPATKIIKLDVHREE